MSLRKPYSFQTRLLIIETQLADIFKTLDINNVPVSAVTEGQLDCDGQLLEEFSFGCKGVTNFRDIVVYGSRDPSQWIFTTSYFKTHNQLNLSNGSFTVSTEGQMGQNSHLTFKSILDSNGTFSAWFDGDVNFDDVDGLVGLLPKGNVQIKNGTLHSFKEIINIQADIQAKDLVISQFIAGDLSARLNYTQKQVLHFRNIRGRVRKSSYTGNVSINVSNDSIKSFLHFPYIRLVDLKYVLKDRISVPFEINGSGVLSAYMDSPLQLNALSYTLQSRFSKVIWERELFDSAVIEIKSKDGFVEADKVEILKNEGRIVLMGQVNPKGYLQAKVEGYNLKLQESQNWVQLIGSRQMVGVADFDMDLKGDFRKPETTARIYVKDSFFIDHPIANSDISLRLRRHQIEMVGSISDKISVQKLIFPYDKNATVYLKASARNLNLNELLFSKRSIHHLYNQFQSDIHGDCDISYKRNQWDRSLSGVLKVSKFILRSQSDTLENKDHFSIYLIKGVFVQNLCFCLLVIKCCA